MKKLSIFSFVLIITMLVGCATTSDTVISPAFYQNQPSRIGIVEVTGDIRGGANKNQVSDFFAMELMRRGYEVIERERVQSVLSEQDFQASDRTSPAEAAQMGQVLNVPAVAMVDVRVDDEKISVTGRIVDVSSGSVIFIGTGQGGTGRRLATVGGAAAGALAGSTIGSGRGRTAAMVVGGVVGGAAGETMAPQTARVIQRSIQEMVKELPAR